MITTKSCLDFDRHRIDGSGMEYEDNVAWTAAMATRAHRAGVAVEAELGKLAGEEDGMSVSEVEARMTDPDQVRCSCPCLVS